MPKKQLKESERIKSHPLTLKQYQVDWVKNHREFNLNSFVRFHLDKYIQLKGEITELWKEEN